MITLILTLINVLVFIGQLSGRIDYRQFAMIPNMVFQGEIHRIITCAFLHGSIEHIFSNMVSFVNLGSYCETHSRKKDYILALLFSLIGSTVVMLMFSPRTTPSLGFSGVVFGIMGYFATLLYHNDGHYDDNEKALLIRMILPNIIISFMPGVSWQAHFGGFAGGVLAGIITKRKP